MLKRLFIKDYKNTSDPAVRIRYGVVAGAFGIATNLLLFVIKIIIGLLANSITIVAEAVNNLSDAGSSILTMIGFRLSNRPADKDHPYGHARYEQITALLVAILVLCIGVLFAKSSVDKILRPQELSISVVTYVILVIAIVVKLVQMLYISRFRQSDRFRSHQGDCYGFKKRYDFDSFGSCKHDSNAGFSYQYRRLGGSCRVGIRNLVGSGNG